MKKKSLLTLVILVCSALVANGQGLPPPPPPPPGLPIDGGILVLLAAGLFYGIKKLRD